MPNKRRMDLLLAAHLRGLAEGAVVVHPPVHILSQWVVQTLRQIRWLKGRAAPRLVDAQELLQLWQQVWPDQGKLLSETEKQLAAKQAIAADRLLRQWHPSDASVWLDRAFFAARQAVEQARQKPSSSCHGWCTADEQISQLCDELESEAALPITLPMEIRLQGFYEWTGLESRLLSALRNRGVLVHDRVEAESANPTTSTAELLDFPGPEAELHAAARWAASRLAGPGSVTRDSPIAVVIHGLEQNPEMARRIFERHLPLPGDHSRLNPEDAFFHLPYGPPLGSHTAVQDAMLLLRLGAQGPRKPINFPSLSRLLLSPHWGTTAEEQFARASLELELRKEGVYQLSFSSLFEAARRLRLDGVLEDSLATLRALRDVDWADPDALQIGLRAWAWPGPQPTSPGLNSLLGRFGSLLERARNLDGIAFAQRLQALQQMCGSERQDGWGGPLSPVQLLTPEDAVGQSFSSAWVAGLSAANWPGPPLNNPFLPIEVTRCIPRTTAEGELQWCERITRGLRQLAPHMVFSWATQADDLPQAPSPLLADLLQSAYGESAAPTTKASTPGVAPAFAPTPTRSWRSYADHPFLAKIPDGQGIALGAEEPIRGGATTLSTQSANPLAAYLKYRLNAQFEAMPEPFADAAWRGSLLHRALQALYQPVLNQATLPTSANIPGAVETALQSLHAFSRLTPIQYRAEQLRLHRVLQDWLDVEGQRPPFRVIALEQELETQLLGHAIHLRLDRADQLQPTAKEATDTADLPILVIDYKSGKSDMGPWSQGRLGEVQLPLYACSWPGPGTVAGLALARVRYGDIDVQGVVADKADQFGRVRTFGKSGAAVHKRFADFAEALDSWRESIEQIAAEYIAGVAGNTLHDASDYAVGELVPLLRLEEGREWLQQHGIPVGGEADSDNENGFSEDSES